MVAGPWGRAQLGSNPPPGSCWLCVEAFILWVCLAFTLLIIKRQKEFVPFQTIFIHAFKLKVTMISVSYVLLFFCMSFIYSFLSTYMHIIYCLLSITDLSLSSFFLSVIIFCHLFIYHLSIISSSIHLYKNQRKIKFFWITASINATSFYFISPVENLRWLSSIKNLKN